MHISSCFSATSVTPLTTKFLGCAQKCTKFSIGKRHLLLVEDNLMLQHIHSMWLEQLGYDVTVVDSGEAALTECLVDYDAVLMDIDLPGDNGIATTQKLQQKNPKLNIPIIACTTHAEAEMKAMCLAAGMVDYLQKPTSRAQLAQSLEIHLSSEVRHG